MTELLRAEHIFKSFGGLLAVDDVSLAVPAGTITSLIGPNGAGKTTLFNCLTGLLAPDQGRVWLAERDITDVPTHERAQMGLGRTFQRLEVFTGLTVFENLQVAAEARRVSSTMRDIFRLRHEPDPAVLAEVAVAMERVGIAHLASRPAGDLPTGVLRLVELGRALCARPSVLLLDELASGLDEDETTSLGHVLEELAADGLGILLIEHDIDLVLRISHDVYVLEFGQLLAHGAPAQITADERVRAAYLGASMAEERS